MEVNKDEDKAPEPEPEMSEIQDFSPQQLATIEANLEDEDEEETEPESKKAKYAGVVKKRTRPNVHSVLYIQAGERDRALIEQG